MIKSLRSKFWVAIVVITITASVLPSTSYSQCTTGCTITELVAGTANNTINVSNNNEVLCLTGSGTYNGNINCKNNTGITICIGPGITFSSSASISNATNGTNVNNHGIFASAYIIMSGRTFTNHSTGTLTSTITLNGGGTINNQGIYTASAFNMSGGTVTNSGTITLSNSFGPSGTGNWSGAGSVAFNGGFSPNSGTFNFTGTTSIIGATTLASGPTLTFGGPTTITGNLTVNSGATVNIASNINITGNISNGGTITVPSTAGSCVTLCPSGTFGNSGGTLTTSAGKTMSLCKTPSPAGTRTANVTVSAPPTSQPTSLTLSQGASIVNGSFAAASGSPQGYMVIRKVGSVITSADYPRYGYTYTVGNTIGTAAVIAVNNSSIRTYSDNVTTCGIYYYGIFNVTNGTSSCAGYNITSPLINNVTISTIAGAVGGGSTICTGDAAPTMSITGQRGSVVKWESATNTAFTTGLTDIISTSASYTPPSSPSVTTYYRAVIRMGLCGALNATHTTVNVLTTPTTTTWTGSCCTNSHVCNNWSLGTPVAASNVTLNGSSTTPTLAADLTINDFSFGGTSPSTAAINLGGRTLTVAGTLTLGTGSSLNVSNGTLVINGAVSGTGTLSGSTTANITIGGSGTIGNLTLAGNTNLNNLTINRTGQVITLNSDVTIGGMLTVTNGTLAIGSARTLALNGAISLSQAIRGDATSTLIIGGSGAITGSLNFANSFQALGTFTMDRASQTITLGSALTVGTAFSVTAGTLAIAANTLTITGTANTTGGQIAVTSSSNISMSGSGTPPTFTFASGANTINNFSSTKTGTTTLGSNLTVVGTLTMPSLAIAGNTLTVSGVIAATTTFAGTTASNLTINGSGTISSLTFDNGNTNVNNLNIGRSSANVSLGRSLAVAGTYTNTNSSYLSLGSNTLTLNGAIVTPSFAGSTTSSLIIGGTGAVGTLNFVSGGQTINDFTVNRTSAVVAFGTNLTINNALVLTLGDVNINGNTLTLAGTVSGSGQVRGSSTSNLTVSGTGSLGTLNFNAGTAQLNNLTMNRMSTGAATLGTNLQVSGNLTFTSGILTSSNNTIALSSTGAVVNESSTSYLRGLLSVARTVAQNSNATFSGAGIEILAAGAAPGLTTVVRNTFTASSGNGNEGIKLTFSITPTVNTNLNATLKVNYFSDSWGLNSKNASSLCFWRSTDGGTRWEKRGFTARDIPANNYTLNNINSFSDWTLGDQNNGTLPVELVSFYGKAQGGIVKLNWSTATEKNNAGYTIEQSTDQISWKSIGTQVGNENSTTLQHYNWSGDVIEKSAYYRISQIDLDGTITKHPSIFLNSEYEGDVNFNTFPNPTTGLINLSYHSLNSLVAAIEVVNQLGKTVMSQQTNLLAGSGLEVIDMSTLPAGIYILKATLSDGAKAQSWRIIKQ